jgi:hypothetical protein
MSNHNSNALMPALIFCFASIGFVWSLEVVARIFRLWLGW